MDEQTKARLKTAIVSDESCLAVAGELREVLSTLSDSERTNRIQAAIRGGVRIRTIGVLLRNLLSLDIYCCDRCGGWVPLDRLRSGDTGDVCEICWQREHDGDSITDYPPSTGGLPMGGTDVTAIGAELETYQFRLGECRHYFSGLSGSGVRYGRRGSLDSCHGIVIGLPPYTLDELRAPDSLWRQIVDWCRSHGALCWTERHVYSRDRYSLHLSLDSRSFDDSSLFRFVHFWGRDSTPLRRMCGGPPNGGPPNCETRGGRVVVRFRGTLRWERFVADHELVYATREYCRDSDSQLTWPAFADWLRTRREDYPLAVGILLDDDGAKE